MVSRHSTHLAAVFLFCSVACATSSSSVPKVGHDPDALHLEAASVREAPTAELAEKIQTACAPVCSSVFVDLRSDTPPEVGHKVVEAAKSVPTPPRVLFITPGGGRIEVDVSGEVDCDDVVSVEDDGIFATRGGEALPPDPDCDVWTATACRLPDGTYDWPRLRTAMGDRDALCIHLADDSTMAQLAALHETFTRPTIRFERPQPRAADIPVDEVRSVLRDAGDDFDWCYRGEVDDAPPMRLVLRVLVGTDGTVERAAVSDGIRTTPQFEECVADVARKLVFERPGDVPVVAEQKLKFSPAADPAMTFAE